MPPLCSDAGRAPASSPSLRADAHGGQHCWHNQQLVKASLTCVIWYYLDSRWSKLTLYTYKAHNLRFSYTGHKMIALQPTISGRCYLISIFSIPHSEVMFCRWCAFCVIIVILLLASSPVRPVEPLEYAAVIDAGSTGSRIYVYSYEASDPTGTMAAVSHHRVRPSLSSFMNETRFDADAFQSIWSFG